MNEHVAANHRNWQDRAALHASDPTGGYRIADVVAGRSCLHRLEAAELGPLAGCRVAHLQCHIGLDTISLAHLGAAEVVGLDFSDVALAAARGFAARAGRSVRFVESDVYAAREALDGSFDRVFVTWGAIPWLPDIGRWAAVVASLLRPGGQLYLAETHPFAACLDLVDGRIVPTFPWRTAPDAPIRFDEPTTYTGDPRPIANPINYGWNHSLTDILGGLRRAGLTVERFTEHELLPYHLFPTMVPAPGEGPTMYELPPDVPRFPLSFSLTATR